MRQTSQRRPLTPVRFGLAGVEPLFLELPQPMIEALRYLLHGRRQPQMILHPLPVHRVRI